MGMTSCFLLCTLLLAMIATSLLLMIRKQKKKSFHNLKLPPGSMGWPYVGETLQLYSQDPSVFFSAKQKR
ncbi:hypothetical protein Cni_G15302 [Canna indica]|uniref:Cytochrome P450 n=1 Tax=Canna indica TaxID=4628 RepID=A0AAQ3QER1_9LILI|nr:hypothetical protein Cni_G15302 [Canna indica]